MSTLEIPKSGNTIAELRARYGDRYRWFLLLSVMIGAMASAMSSTIINVAIPDLSHHFMIGQERAQWAASSFMIAMTVAMLATPWMLTRFGYRTTYVGAMTLLLIGGLAGGSTDTYSFVLAARVAQGLAAGVLQPIPAIIILRAFQPHEQGRASGLFTMGVVLAPAIGPSVGGVLVDMFGWRSIFFMVVPFCLASYWMAVKFVPKLAAPAEGAAANPRLDWQSMILGAMGTISLLNGLVELRGGSTAQAASLLVFSAVSFTAFVWWQRNQMNRGKTPLMNLDIYKYRQFAMGSIVAFTYGAALYGSTYLLPVYMQFGLGMSPSRVGAILMPSGLLLAVAIAFVGRLADTKPTYVLVCTGLASLAASFALMTTLGLQSSVWLLLAFTILSRIGLGFILPSLNLGALRPLDKALIPQGASAINFGRMLGGASGVSLCAVLLEWRLEVHGDSLAVRATSIARIAAFDEVFLMLAAVCALSIVAALQIREPKSARTASLESTESK